MSENELMAGQAEESEPEELDIDIVDIHCPLCQANDPYTVGTNEYECQSCGCEFTLRTDRKDKADED